ncbi:glycosyltransferase family 4 protein [Spirosoma pomorum]
MKILLTSVVAQSSRTGVTAHYNRLLAQLADEGESVELITPADTPRLLKKCLGALRRVAARFGPNGRVLFWELENFVSIWAIVRQRGAGTFDLIHAQDATSGAAAAFATRSNNTPVAVTCHFNDDPLKEYRANYAIGPWTDRQLTRWYQFLFRQADAFITVSDYTKRMAAWLIPKQVPCAVIQNGVEFPVPLPPRRKQGSLIIANIGTLEDRKNQRMLIEAADELRSRGFVNFQVWLLGEGEKRAEWQTLVRERKLEAYVTFMGYRPDVMTIMPKVSLYVHTALNESWGYTITEAIATGTPVLALATGGIPEQFDTHQPGLLPADTTATGLADTVLRYQFANARRHLAYQQRIYAQSRFRLDIMVDKHRAFYRDVLNQQEVAYQPTPEAVYLAPSSPQV